MSGSEKTPLSLTEIISICESSLSFEGVFFPCKAFMKSAFLVTSSNLSKSAFRNEEASSADLSNSSLTHRNGLFAVSQPGVRFGDLYSQLSSASREILSTSTSPTQSSVNLLLSAFGFSGLSTAWTCFSCIAVVVGS